jgi:hypothetical protein
MFNRYNAWRQYAPKIAIRWIMSRVESVLLRDNTKYVAASISCRHTVLISSMTLFESTTCRVKKAKLHSGMTIFAFPLDTTCYP